MERKNRKNFFVFLDEIQYIPEHSNLLKMIHDHHPDIKLIVTGSSSFEIRKKFKHTLAGRKRVFILHTLSFDEFLRFKRFQNTGVKRR
ncbi:AAA family ATPase [candidate division WOR-3 bacterium]|nr:AAA family ATPase [candidate division WOR-3 bacterium]